MNVGRNGDIDILAFLQKYKDQPQFQEKFKDTLLAYVSTSFGL